MIATAEVAALHVLYTEEPTARAASAVRAGLIWVGGLVLGVALTDLWNAVEEKLWPALATQIKVPVILASLGAVAYAVRELLNLL